MRRRSGLWLWHLLKNHPLPASYKNIVFLRSENKKQYSKMIKWWSVVFFTLAAGAMMSLCEWHTGQTQTSLWALLLLFLYESSVAAPCFTLIWRVSLLLKQRKWTCACLAQVHIDTVWRAWDWNKNLPITRRPISFLSLSASSGKMNFTEFPNSFYLYVFVHEIRTAEGLHFMSHDSVVHKLF